MAAPGGGDTGTASRAPMRSPAAVRLHAKTSTKCAAADNDAPFFVAAGSLRQSARDLDKPPSPHGGEVEPPL